MDTAKVLDVLNAIGAKIEEEKEYLTELDNVIGDGDHGINMARGFQMVETKLPTLADKDIGTILKTVGMTLVSTVGGSSGPLYGTAFMKAGMTMAGKTEMSLEDFIQCLDVAIEGVKMRGKAVQGEKTMLDAMIPALDAMKAALTPDAAPKTILEIGVGAAWEGVEYTKTIIATKGRASYVGERSIGHQDPGATSFSYILETISNCLYGGIMVGIVIVSHSEKLAEGVVDVTKIMADGCPIVAAGGMEDGSFGTSYEKIMMAIESVHGPEGVLVLMDMGSAVMTTEMVLEDLGYDDVFMVDCPIAEGAIAATLASCAGADLAGVKQEALSSKTADKL